MPFTVSVIAPLPAGSDPGDSDVIAGAGFTAASTVTTGLVAARVYELFGKSRNSYCPGVEGIVTVHVRLVTPVPTYVNVM